MTTPPASERSSLRFLEARPRDLHGTQPPWHRLALVVRALPLELGRLAADLNLPPGGRVLDYGCGDSPYRSLFGDDVEYVPADIPGNPRAAVEVAADGTLPLPEGSFDVVLSTQVLEHAADPAVYLRESARVLKPGGRMLLSTHGLMFYHPDPVDYWRWTCAGLQEAVARAGLRVVRFEGVVGMAATGFQLIQEAWYYRLPMPLRHALALLLQTLAKLADRLERREDRLLNSMVYVLVAEKR